MDAFPLPIVDHHAHLRPGPAGLEAVRRFEQQGGTHLFLATQNYLDHPPLSVEEYREQFDRTLAIARSVEESTRVRVFPVLAPYPVDLVHLVGQRPLAEAEGIQLDALRLAGQYVSEGKAVALGEVGRAHFPVDEAVRLSLERVLRSAMATAKDVHCPLVLHTGDLDGAGYLELAEMGRQEGLPLTQLVKHYARAYLPPLSRHGVIPSFLSRREVVRGALSDPGPWFLETDYLDDPARPGAVLALDTVPRRAAWVRSLETGPDLVERLRIPFVDSPRKIYGLDLERP